MIPVPGLGIAIDLAAIITAMRVIRNDFNLTEARLDKFVMLAPNIAPMVNSLINYATTEGAVQLVKRFAVGQAVTEVAKYFPGIGTIVAGSISFAITLLILNLYIEDCYDIASEMLSKHFVF